VKAAPPIEVSGDWDAATEAFLAERLYEFNARTSGHADGKAVIATLRDEGGRIVAAASGHTWGGTGQLTYLWVDEPRRGQGLGRALVDAFEREARRRRCTQAVLLTHSFQAPRFYEKLGYRVRATIPDYPRGHSQLVYMKPLADADGP
jgi:ribosomal protein S18 acetylase RimI-like enzyme